MVIAPKGKPTKDEISFDSDEDLPGLDDSTDKTPRDSPTPPPRKKPEVTSRQNSQGSSGDIFGADGDDLPDTGTVCCIDERMTCILYKCILLLFVPELVLHSQSSANVQLPKTVAHGLEKLFST